MTGWYEVQRRISTLRERVVDLSTGEPLQLPEIHQIVLDALLTFAGDASMAEEIGGYVQLDGLAELATIVASVCGRAFGTAILSSQVVITPGAQAAIRYLHELALASGTGVMYPVGLEFPGCVVPDHQSCVVAGRYRSKPLGDSACLPVIDFESLRWQGVGFVFLSRPHNPTGHLWPASDVLTLAKLAAQQDALVVLDETYALPFAPLTREPPTFVHAPNIVHVFSFSKVGLAGERVGAVICPERLAERLRAVLRRNIIQSPIVGQRIALALIHHLESDASLATSFGRQYAARWEVACQTLASALKGAFNTRIAKWDGGPFLWCEWTHGPASADVFEALLAGGVAVTPSAALTVADAMVDGSLIRAVRIGLGGDSDELVRGLTLVEAGLTTLGFGRSA